MSDPHQYDDSSAPARSAGHAADAADPVSDPYAPEQPTARRARDEAPARSADSAPAWPGQDAPGPQASSQQSAVRQRDGEQTQQATGQQAAAQQDSAQQAVAPRDSEATAAQAPTHGIHVPVSEYSEPKSKVFSNLNLNGAVPARVRPAIGEWGPRQVPSTKKKKRSRVMVGVWFVVSLLAVLALGYFFFMALTGRPLFG